MIAEQSTFWCKRHARLRQYIIKELRLDADLGGDMPWLGGGIAAYYYFRGLGGTTDEDVDG